MATGSGTVSIAVRALCNFTARRGDLDTRFTQGPSADEGRIGHLIAASRRGPDYQAEVSLQGEHRQLLIRGRADGYDAGEQRLDEFKTYRGELSRMPLDHRALHWAQLKIYGWLLCQREGLPNISLALVYFDIVSQDETILREDFSATTLERFFSNSCDAFERWASAQEAYLQARDLALRLLRFPFDEVREGQQELMERVGAATSGQCVLVEAPTGIGKTMGTLFPTLQALAERKVDRIFYLTAKSTGRRTALDALSQLTCSMSPSKLRVLELVAKEKLCVHPDKECHGDSCPLAKGFHDRLPAAREVAVAMSPLHEKTIRNIASSQRVCPYYLSQEMAQWSDVIVADYNYYFDASAALYRMTLEHEWKVCLLIDEAHNLPGRARSMYSGALNETQFIAALREAPLSLYAPLSRLLDEWRLLHDPEPAAYLVGAEIPANWLKALETVVASLTDYSATTIEPLPASLQDLLFAALHFCRLADDFGEDSIFSVATASDDVRQSFAIDNIVPARFLRPRFDAAHCSILFSATLRPAQFYRDLLGLPSSSEHRCVRSPFIKDQLAVTLVCNVSTSLRRRSHSVIPITRLIADIFAARPGNYLAFVSSFEYLEQLFSEFSLRYPDVPCWQQSRHMSERERTQFIDRFEPESMGVGFAVLGGVFAEGIDLPGNRLIGAFIATLGLPQINPLNTEIMQRMETLYGAGFEYTYLYPGLQKVVQAAGRIIRTTSDQGSLHLIDSRYEDEAVRNLLPAWWDLSTPL